MRDPVRLGIVGAGSIALRGLFPHLTMDDVRDRVRITAVCDPVVERAQAAAAKFGVPAAYASLEELLAAGDVDAVSICSPIGVHFEQGMAAVASGVHVHFNKSMTTTVDEANRLIAAAQAKGIKLVSSPGEMLRPRHQKIKQLLADGAIGRLTWAVTGAAFGTYHEDEVVGARRQRSAHQHQPGLVLPQAGRRAALRHDGLRAACADGYPGAGQARDRLFRRACARAAVPGADAADRHGRQHADGAGFWRLPCLPLSMVWPPAGCPTWGGR